jgi:type IV pilus assembly protein PilQ
MTDTKSIRIALSLLFLAAVPHAVAQQQQQGEFVMAPLLEEQKPEPLDPDEIMAASESLEVIRKLVRREKYLEASEALKPLLGKPYFQQEIRGLMYEINFNRQKADLKRRQDETVNVVMSQAIERWVLPETAGQERIVVPHGTNLPPPPGPMEDLVNRKVTIDLEDATIMDIIETLGELDGMNFIADEGLESDTTLRIKFTDVPLKELLDYVVRNMGISFNFGENVIWISADEEAPGPGGAQMELHMFELQSAYAESGGGGGRSGGGGGGGGVGSSGPGEDILLAMLENFVMEDSPDGALMELNRDYNILMMRNTRDKLREAGVIIDMYDRPPLQILVEARYITISQKELYLLGTSIDNLSFEQGFIPKINTDFTAPLPSFGNDLGGKGRLAVSGIIDNVTYNAVIETIKQNNTSRTVSAPRVLVINNQTASIFKGDTIRYFTEFENTSNVVSGDNPVIANAVVPVGSASELSIGITLNVTANVGNDLKTIMLSLQAEISEFLGFDTLSPNVTQPRTSENTLDTTCIVNTGQTIVLGGMITSQSSTTVSKLPFLGDLPWMGKLFSKYDTNENPSHLLVFVQAVIIDPDGRRNVVVSQDLDE